MTKKMRVAFTLLGLTALLALQFLPVAMAVSDPTISCQVSGCDYTTFTPSQTKSIGMTVAWSGLTSTDTYCVFATSTQLTACPAGAVLTNSNGFALGGTADYSTFSLGNAAGSHDVTLTVTSPASPGSTSFYVEACDLTQASNGCGTAFEASLTMTLVQTPEFGASIAIVAAVALLGLLLVRKQSLKSPSIKAV